eukprot:TRINITY_DN2526_c0_g1_i4.p1 TRINITY_DN2526_c0_g1~~TRINITY_DN2526_c0_g1_i4.p1  ORF type:complete len:410 (+),score=79.08 TRINITY_DN2526_c0_g1_i4:305-1534(+)
MCTRVVEYIDEDEKPHKGALSMSLGNVLLSNEEGSTVWEVPVGNVMGIFAADQECLIQCCSGDRVVHDIDDARNEEPLQVFIDTFEALLQEASLGEVSPSQDKLPVDSAPTTPQPIAASTPLLTPTPSLGVAPPLAPVPTPESPAPLTPVPDPPADPPLTPAPLITPVPDPPVPLEVPNTPTLALTPAPDPPARAQKKPRKKKAKAKLEEPPYITDAKNEIKQLKKRIASVAHEIAYTEDAHGAQQEALARQAEERDNQLLVTLAGEIAAASQKAIEQNYEVQVKNDRLNMLKEQIGVIPEHSRGGVGSPVRTWGSPRASLGSPSRAGSGRTLGSAVADARKLAELRVEIMNEKEQMVDQDVRIARLVARVRKAQEDILSISGTGLESDYKLEMARRALVQRYFQTSLS